MTGWWVVHLEGPDDVYTVDNEQEARDIADDINAVKPDDDPLTPRFVAKVYSPEEWAARAGTR
jgi:hypothetical protein